MILLDTHVWVWWLGQPDKLSENARKALEAAVNASGICISSISVWEVALLVERQRLELTQAGGDHLVTYRGKRYFFSKPLLFLRRPSVKFD